MQNKGQVHTPERLVKMGHSQTLGEHIIKKRTGFTLAFPQQSDSKGNLLKDGAMIDYIFKNGTFHETYQTL